MPRLSRKISRWKQIQTIGQLWRRTISSSRNRKLKLLAWPKPKDLLQRQLTRLSKLAYKLKNRCANRKRFKGRKNGRRRSARLRSSSVRSRSDLSAKNR